MGGGDMVHQPGKPSSLYEFRTLEVEAQSLSAQPFEAECSAALDVVPCQTFADVHRQFEIASREKEPFFCVPLMSGDEVGTCHTVLISEDEVVAGGYS